GSVSQYFSEILTEFGWAYASEVQCNINGIPGVADKIIHPPGMPNKRFWFEEKREDPDLFGSLSSRTEKQQKYRPLLKNGAKPVSTFDRSNVGLKANTQFEQEYIEFNWTTREDFRNFIRQNTPDLAPPKPAREANNQVRLPGGKTVPL